MKLAIRILLVAGAAILVLYGASGAGDAEIKTSKADPVGIRAPA